MTRTSKEEWARPTVAVATIASLFIAGSTVPVRAHEFWIDPLAERLLPGETISADLRIGQNLSGAAYPYVSKTVAGMTHWSPDNVNAITAREGDRPALNSVATEPGLHRITVQSHPAYIVFDDMVEFEEYLEYEGLGEIADQHRERGLPDTEIAEAYIRNAKTLLQVGPVDTSQSDQPTDLPFELTALGNPYDADIRSLDIQLTWQDRPVPGVQVTLFHLPDGGTAPQDSRRSVLKTDTDGVVSIDLGKPGAFLLNAVRMSPVDGPGSVVWESYWASLTFNTAR
ncbi:MAG: DUF4198 domain-containing protein [Silicimonas sp.]|nr:DUF4198 domain-containing protein [Silicimonas sp.]